MTAVFIINDGPYIRLHHPRWCNFSIDVNYVFVYSHGDRVPVLEVPVYCSYVHEVRTPSPNTDYKSVHHILHSVVPSFSDRVLEFVCSY